MRRTYIFLSASLLLLVILGIGVAAHEQRPQAPTLAKVAGAPAIHLSASDQAALEQLVIPTALPTAPAGSDATVTVTAYDHHRASGYVVDQQTGQRATFVATQQAGTWRVTAVRR